MHWGTCIENDLMRIMAVGLFIITFALTWWVIRAPLPTNPSETVGPPASAGRRRAGADFAGSHPGGRE